LTDFPNRQVEGRTIAGLDGLIAQAEQHLDKLDNRLETRRCEIQMEQHYTIADLAHLGQAWVLSHPERGAPDLVSMITDAKIEKSAVRVVIEHEEARGCVVESVENQDRGFDLISRRPHPEDPKIAVEVHFIRFKDRAAERLKNDYWLYVVFDCAATPKLHAVQGPARFAWQPMLRIEHYQVNSRQIISGENPC